MFSGKFNCIKAVTSSAFSSSASASASSSSTLTPASKLHMTPPATTTNHADYSNSHSCNMTKYSISRNWLMFAVIIFVIASNEFVEGALRNVNLIIEPPAVRRGQHAILRCMYNLDGSPLYAAKFYRGLWEFYRYTPGEFPNTKVFPYAGIHVDVTSSNATQVLIRNVDFDLSGNFSCEVTTDAPSFSTAIAVGTLQVVELPDKRPTLSTDQTRYEPGDILRANCSTPPSRPPADLKFTINNMVINNAEVQYIPTVDTLRLSQISLKLHLQGVHFSSANPSIYHGQSGYGSGGQPMNSVHGGGSLILRCTAQIGDLYQEYKEVELGTPQKDPVPARVTHSSGSGVKNFMSSFFSSGSTPNAIATALPMSALAVSVVGATRAGRSAALAAVTAALLLYIELAAIAPHRSASGARFLSQR